MSLWEPFSVPARRAMVRSQEVAQMFGSAMIATDHMAFALGETDDEVGHLLAAAVDRNALRERLGGVGGAPSTEMVFTAGAKRVIELAFEHARRLNQMFIGSSHLALGLLDVPDSPPLLPLVDPGDLRAALAGAAENEAVAMGTVAPAGPRKSRALAKAWELDPVGASGEPHSAATALLAALLHSDDLAPGTRVTLTIAAPNARERAWTWTRKPRASG